MLKIEDLKANQIELVQKLAKEIWDEHYIKILSQAQIDYMLEKFYNSSLIEKEINEGILWKFVFENENPIGYLVCKIEPEKIYISKIYLKAETRGKGYGKNLIHFVENLAKERNKKAIYLNVNKYNSDSIAFYNHLGLMKVDEGVFDIGNGYVMDDFILEKSLQ